MKLLQEEAARFKPSHNLDGLMDILDFKIIKEIKK